MKTLVSGFNFIRLSPYPNHSYTVLRQEKEVVRLGENEFKNHQLQPEAMKRAVLVCKKFVELATSFGAGEIIAVATSAAREAKNQAEFLKDVERAMEYKGFPVMPGTKDNANRLYEEVFAQYL